MGAYQRFDFLLKTKACETARYNAMTDEELTQLVASLAVAQQETASQGWRGALNTGVKPSTQG
jgi:hypothetical protein